MAGSNQETGHPEPQASSTAWTIGRLLEWTTDYLRRESVESPRLATEILLACALGCKKIDLYARYSGQPAADQLVIFRELVRKAARRMPIAYLTGRKEFYSLDFEVTPAVLIPRPETEVLVDQVIAYWRARPQQRIDILDLGTGSGCVGIVLAHRLAQAEVVGSDISAEALGVAACNLARLGPADRFRLVQADGLALPADATPPGGFDTLVSNPPYIARDAADSLSPEVRDYEPHLALFGGADGLEFYRRIAAHAADILNRSGSIFLEIGYDQHQAVLEILEAGGFEHMGTWRDRNEGHARVVGFCLGR